LGLAFDDKDLRDCQGLLSGFGGASSEVAKDAWRGANCRCTFITEPLLLLLVLVLASMAPVSLVVVGTTAALGWAAGGARGVKDAVAVLGAAAGGGAGPGGEGVDAAGDEPGMATAMPGFRETGEDAGT
jgi:hypothetical protein